MRKPETRRLCVFACAALVAASASALTVVYDGRTPEASREWAERSYIREQMEVLAAKICEALYEGQARESLHENFQISLYLAPEKGGNPAFASGRRITWKVGPNPGGDGSGGTGLLCHEMTHVLDMGSDGVFTEAMADWVRNYKVWYNRCSNPSYILDIRYKALRGGRHYGKYMSGANFLDFMTQNYGEGTIYKILMGYKHHGRDPWEKLFGKNFDGLLDEWRHMETIYDPVFQWTYNGTVAGVIRNDTKFCGLRSLSAHDTLDKSGAILDGVTAGRVNGVVDGNMSIALHGCFPGSGGDVAIASLGAAREGNGKAILLASGAKRDMLSAYVVATVPGRPCAIIAKKAIPVGGLSEKSHSIVLSMSGGDTAHVVVDGQTTVEVDMKSKCGGCAFAPVFALGGMSGGIGIAGTGIVEPRYGKNVVRLDDVRVFTRAFRARETASYATTFNEAYRPAVAVKAKWCGGQGGTEIDDPSKWFCANAIGEKVVALPTKDTDVLVSGKAIPSIPAKAHFERKSFTIDGWAVADAANIDLRGAGIVDIADNSKIITRGDYLFAVSKLRGKRVRLDGKLAVTSAMRIDNRLEMKSGSVLRTPANPSLTLVGELAIAGEGNVTIRPGVMPDAGKMTKVLRVNKLPDDLSRLALFGMESPADAEFKPSTNKKYLSVRSIAR